MSALTQNDAGNKDSWKSSLNIFQRRVALQEGTESARITRGAAISEYGDIRKKRA